MWSEFVLVKIKGHRNKGGREILMGDNTCGGRISTKIVIRSIPVLLTTIHTYDCKEW